MPYPRPRRVFDRSTPLATALTAWADLNARALKQAQESWAQSLAEARLLAIESDALVRATIDAQRAEADRWRVLGTSGPQSND